MKWSAAFLLLIPLVLAGAAWAQPGNVIIIPGYAIGDITLGMTQAMVLNRLGLPDEISNDDNGDGGTNVYWIYPQEERKVMVVSWTRRDAKSGGVDFLYTDSRRYTTSKGIAIGAARFSVLLEKYGPPDRIQSSARAAVTFSYDDLGVRFRIETESGVVSAITVVPRKP